MKYSLLFFCALLFSQKNITYQIHYQKFFNNASDLNAEKPVVFANAENCLISAENIIQNKAAFPYETSIISSKGVLLNAVLQENKNIQTFDSLTLKKYNYTITNETKKILGFVCKKATTVVNSNKIDIWYTNELKINASPLPLGYSLGLVLEINRNNTSQIIAQKIIKLKSKFNFPNTQNQNLSILQYRDLLWKSRFTTIPIFDNEIINFSDINKDKDSVLRFAKGTVILKKIKFPTFNFPHKIFAEIKQLSNGDAYDRTGSVFAIPINDKKTFLNALTEGINAVPIYEAENGKKYQGIITTENYIPAIELMRFFTSFGISKYNHIQIKDKTWQQESIFKQEITEFSSLFNGKEIYIGMFVGNYDAGGHKASLQITVHKEESEKDEPLDIIPLFNTVNILEMAGQEYSTLFSDEKGLIVEFYLENELQNAKLRYTTTGHGGWENGDEYLQKQNAIYLDDSLVYSFIPWRTDCGSYRLYNPASGNFENGLSSSDYSRSNWCPGTVTNPEFISLGNLRAGKHKIQIKIPQGKPEGESFSAWNVSGVLIGKIKK